jgi:hypothetical protein
MELENCRIFMDKGKREVGGDGLGFRGEGLGVRGLEFR